MAKVVSQPLREFAYFDREKVIDFVCAIQGGLVQGRKKSQTDKSPRIDFGALLKIFGIGRKGGERILSREEITSDTDASLFEQLYRATETQELMCKLSAFDPQVWESLQVGDLLEVHAQIELPAMQKVLDLVRGLASFVPLLSPERMKDPQFSQAMAYFNTISAPKETFNVRILPEGAPSKGFLFISSLSNSHLKVSKDELRNEYFVFGRVQKKLATHEQFELFSFLPREMSISGSHLQDLLSHFTGMPSEVGPEPSMNDLQASYPAIILTPIAIYR